MKYFTCDKGPAVWAVCPTQLGGKRLGSYTSPPLVYTLVFCSVVSYLKNDPNLVVKCELSM